MDDSDRNPLLPTHAASPKSWRESEVVLNIWNILTFSKLNYLLLFIPLGIWAENSTQSNFSTNYDAVY
jgi:hypothetical protein